MGFVRHAVIQCVLATSLFFSGAASNAQVTADTTRGLDWMRAQVHADGTIAVAASAVATDAQTSSEVAATLAALSGSSEVSAQLLERLAVRANEPTEYLARKLLARSAASADIAALAIALAARQQVDGGFQPYAQSLLSG